MTNKFKSENKTEFYKSAFKHSLRFQNYEKRITEAYDRIERLEYRIVELENQIKTLKNKH